ncbi:ligase-associated DNA damage response exonuclease [Methylocystis parvus]|uniref:Ligase-associated DNA damage response exonuclease n=1 Tax=Methylocystis parvus TaxID=134 RepID=A0A6B8M140_9HYPH|nr:ligase-associated DNA damage response exonuclease [Methylocystis parvus]QGM96581.1 ligase-associated DNA damage response exonuclease [Methylocystis parvus]WBJ99565.1 ligase-associated DNA damage response exonuclease [Methylocystis parvus OBBP]
MELIVASPEGLYCPAGDFHIDPWRPVARAVITHGHSDHARWGSRAYLCQRDCAPILRKRLGDVSIETLDYGAPIEINGVTLSLHPAGHVLGSAQVRVESRGEVWVASGDYKIEPDNVSAPFEPVRCGVFITESTFGLPIYRWRRQSEVMADVDAWWRANAEAGRASVIFAYGLGKAQRVLGNVDASIGPIYCHGAIEPMNEIYRMQGVALPETRPVSQAVGKNAFAGALIIAPPSAEASPWMRRFGDYSDAFASGWMQIRGNRRRRGVDRGFALSDHADWPGLLAAIHATGAERVYATHGSVGALTRYLRERGLDARDMHTEYGEEEAESGAAESEGAT